MRLTLRTMLAYMDDILDPADAEELSKRIDQSDFAHGLMERIRSATRRIRLGVPALEGKGMGLDPNTVAEYLDNELPPDRVPDFEKVCLESDVHLAEVAACHQILTLILGEAADVDPELRRRMYLLGTPEAEGGEPTAAHEAAIVPPVTVVASHAAPSEPVSPAARKAAEVPDYLRAGQRANLRPMLIALALAFVVCWAALRWLGPFDRNHPLMRPFVGTSEPQVAQQPTPRGPAVTANVNDEDARPQGKPTVPDSVGGEDKSDAVGPQPSPPTEPPSPEKPVAPGPAEPDTARPPQEPEKPAVMPDEKPAAPAGKAEAVKPLPKQPVVPIAEPPLPPPARPAATPPAPAPGPAAIVGFVKPSSESQVILSQRAPSGEWARLAPRAKLSAGDRLLVLPTYAPEIVLQPGVQVVFAGPSAVQPLAQPSPDESRLAVTYGRLFISTAGVAGARIQLDLAGHRGTATFGDAASEIAVGVRRYLAPGANPERDAAVAVAHLYTTIGRVQWEDGDSGVVAPIEQGQVQVIIGERLLPVQAAQLPGWARREPLSAMDRIASPALESVLSADRAILLSLKERTRDRRSENRALAARCLSYLDAYDDLIEALGSSQHKPHWSAELTALRDAVARSPKSAAGVRESLERMCQDDGRLYRMLWGYSPEQLREGAATLVGYLQDDALIARVMALDCLERITKKTLSFFPEVPQAQRKSAFQRWKQALDKREIVYDANSLPNPATPTD